MNSIQQNIFLYYRSCPACMAVALVLCFSHTEACQNSFYYV